MTTLLADLNSFNTSITKITVDSIANFSVIASKLQNQILLFSKNFTEVPVDPNQLQCSMTDNAVAADVFDGFEHALCDNTM